MIPPAITSAADVPSCPAWPLCGCATCNEGRRAASAPMLPPPPPVMTELANDLAGLGLKVAARLVLEGRREYAATIVEEIGAPVGTAGSLAVRSLPMREVFAAQVAAWGEGRDAAVLASNRAWNGVHGWTGCQGCALAALASGDATTMCGECRAEAAS